MKKIDLHVHTLPNKYLDGPFEFGAKNLFEYVSSNNLDIIAITNHNLFNADNFSDVKKILKDLDVTVFPGIEVSLEGGHILLIGDDTEETLNTLKSISSYIEPLENNDHFRLSIDDFNRICVNKGFLMIPHCVKDPKIDDGIISKIGQKIFVGEVDSAKHFYQQKKKEALYPVMFSDIRIKKADDTTNYVNKSKFTYIDCDGDNFATLVSSLKNKNAISINSKGLPELFEILNGKVFASTGINVLVGKRSSGKTFTLNDVYSSDPSNILYIRQFEITRECEEKDFNERNKVDEQSFIINYFKELIQVFDYLDSLNCENIEKDLTNYLISLKKSANNAVNDQFSKSLLFNYNPFDTSNIVSTKKIIESTMDLLDNIEYKDVIDKHLQRNDLIHLFSELVSIYKKKYKNNKAIEKTNNILRYVSNNLGKKSVDTQIDYCDFVELAKVRYSRLKFNHLIENFVEKTIDREQIVNKFRKKVIIKKNTNKLLTKAALGVDKQNRIDYLFENKPFDAYFEAKNDSNIKNGLSNYRYRLFIDYSVEVINQYGKQVSGGQKAEFILLQKLSNYQNFNTVLIDEMESSFDNMFLYKDIIELIRDIAKKSTVFISTHNNNLGVSLKPDYYIYHEVKFDNNEFTFNHYCGKSSDIVLKNENNEEYSLKDILIDTMEAGDEAYQERNGKYEITCN